MGVHLGGYMQACLGKGARKLAGKADILHDEGVSTSSVSLTSQLENLIRLLRKNGGIERHINADVTQMGVAACLLQRLEREIVGAATGIEGLEAQVNRVGSGTHGSVQGLHAARRGKKLDLLHMACLSPVWVGRRTRFVCPLARWRKVYAKKSPAG